MTLSAALWAGSADLAGDALAGPFVTGLADGSLPRDLFAGYVAQDAFFLEAFARGYALGRVAGIAAAVEEARALLAVDGVVGVNLSGMGSDRGVDDGALIKAAVAAELRGTR